MERIQKCCCKLCFMLEEVYEKYKVLCNKYKFDKSYWKEGSKDAV